MVAIIEIIDKLLNYRKRRLLAFAELAMPADKFERYKKELLRELGNSGFKRDLEKAFGREKER